MGLFEKIVQEETPKKQSQNNVGTLAHRLERIRLGLPVHIEPGSGASYQKQHDFMNPEQRKMSALRAGYEGAGEFVGVPTEPEAYQQHPLAKKLGNIAAGVALTAPTLLETGGAIAAGTLPQTLPELGGAFALRKLIPNVAANAATGAGLQFGLSKAMGIPTGETAKQAAVAGGISGVTGPFMGLRRGILADPDIIAEQQRNADVPHTIEDASPQRQALRETIADKVYGTGALQKNKKAFIIIGQPATGKSTLANPLTEEHGAFLLDPDNIKKEIPEYQQHGLTEPVHEESSLITSKIAQKIATSGDNVVWPTLGDNLNSLRSKIKMLKDNGYEVHLKLMDMRPFTAVKRAIARWRSPGGRFVNPKFVEDVGLNPRQNYDIIKREGGVDSYEHYWNEIPRERPPSLIESSLQPAEQGSFRSLLLRLFRPMRGGGVQGSREAEKGTAAGQLTPKRELIGPSIGFPRPSGTESFKSSKFQPEAASIIDKTRNLPEYRDLDTMQRRGVVSDEDAVRSALAFGITPEELKDLKPGTALPEEHLIAGRFIVRDSALKVADLANRLGDVPSGPNRILLEQAMKDHFLYQAKLAGGFSESARGLRVAKLTVPELEAKMRVRNLQAEATTEELWNNLSKNIDFDKVAQHIKKLPKQDVERYLGSAKLAARKYTVWDQINEVRQNGLLSSPSTFLVKHNLGRMIGTMTRLAEETISTPVDAVISKVFGTPRGRFSGEAAADMFGMMSGSWDGLKAFLDSIVHERAGQGMMAELGRPGALPGPVGAFVRMPGRIISAFDALMRQVNSKGILYREAYRQAASEHLDGTEALVDRIGGLLKNPSNKMMNEAATQTDHYMFKDPLGGYFETIDEAAKKHTLLRWILPFRKTPFNLASFAARRFPGYGFKYTDTPMVDRIVRQTLGAAVLAAFYPLLKEGKITGAAPRDSSERQLFYAEGKQPFSIKIGNTWYRYSGIEPVGMALGTLAAIKDASNDQDVYRMLSTLAGEFTSQPALLGLKNVVDALSDPGIDNAFKMKRFIQGTGASFIPLSALLNRMRMTTDPTLRQTRTFGEFVENRIPGMSQRLLPQLDVFGKPIQSDQSSLGRLMSPSVSSEEKDNPVAKELDRIGVHLPQASREITVAGKKHAVPTEIRDVYVKKRGDVYMRLNRIINAPNYQKLTDEEKRQAMQSIVDSIARDSRMNYTPNQRTLIKSF